MSDENETVGSGRRRRRIWSEEAKRQILSECRKPGVSAAEIARRHGINANLLFTWRRRLGANSSAGSQEPTRILPVTVVPDMPIHDSIVSSDLLGRMEIVLAGGDRIIVGVDVDANALARVVKALLQR